MIRESNELVEITSFNSEGYPCILKGVLKLLHLSKPWKVTLCLLHWELTEIYLTLFLRAAPMYWTENHDLLLIREVLAVDPYSQPKGSRERAKLWEEIAMSLNSVSAPQFSVTVRSVRDRVNLVLIKTHKKKVSEENKASGITPDEPSEFESGMDEICEKAEAAERDQQVISEERKANLKKDKKQAEDMRAKALEKVGET